MECDKGTVPLSHREGRTDGWVAEGLAEPGDQLLGVTLQIVIELGRGHAAHLRDLLLVDMQLARLNMGCEHLTPLALVATVNWASSANLPSPAATFVVCTPMGSPVARDVPETVFACIATIQASTACDKGGGHLTHSGRVAVTESSSYNATWEQLP